MLKLFILITGLFLQTSVYAAALTSTYTHIKLTNNTKMNLHVSTHLETTDSQFKRSRDWEEKTQTILPYETKEILWFTRHFHLKQNQLYRFNIEINQNEISQNNMHIIFDLKAKPTFGSTLNTHLILPNNKEETILNKSGFFHSMSKFWDNAYDLYGRSANSIGYAFNNFQFVVNEEKPTLLPKSNEADEINILTYNTQLMPFYANGVNDLNQPGLRVTEIPKNLSPYDVIILEELFDKDLRTKMIATLHLQYPYHTEVVGHATKKILTGGVMIFSKWPIVHESEIVYDDATDVDKLAAKGAIYAAINKQGKIYHVIGTHLQSGNNVEQTRARDKQLAALHNFMERLNLPTQEPLLLGGDFNVNEYSPEFLLLLQTLNVNLPTNIGYRYSADCVTDSMNVGKTRAHIDFVLSSNQHIQAHTALNNVFILRALNNEKMWPKFDLSDHFPVESYFKFN